MALQSSGPISISQIHNEVGNGSYSLHSLSVAAGKSTPDSMSEFYGYSRSLSGYNYEVQLGGYGATYIITPTDFDPIVGGYYHLYAPSVLGTMNGSNCWYVLNANFYYPDGAGAFTSNCEV